MKIRRVTDLDVRGKRVFVRVDFNVPLKKDGDRYVVADTNRIEGALETIRWLVDNEARVILASHLGRPKGGPDPKYSLEPVGEALSVLLSRDVILTEDCIGDGPRGLSHRMRNGDVMLLENLRFHAGEEENSPEFANRLLELCDLYVTDAFGSLHRAHASTAGLPMLMRERAKGLGFLVVRELKYLAPLREDPRRPFMLVMGGSKVSDKIAVIEHFLPKADKILIGGAMAYAFLKSRGHQVGKSLCDDKQVQLAAKLLKAAEARRVEMVLPVDHVVASSLEDTAGARTTAGVDIADGQMGLDIGPKTVEVFRAALAPAETIFWNGPVGVFETPAFANGTLEVAKIIAGSRAQKLAGGGDSAAAIAASGVEAQFDFISTGGGATLEYLEGKELPGLKALDVSPRPS